MGGTIKNHRMYLQNMQLRYESKPAIQNSACPVSTITKRGNESCDRYMREIHLRCFDMVLRDR